MPRGKQFDVDKKAKVMAWFYEGISPKEIASRIQRDVSGFRKVINQNKTLPLTATPSPLKKRSGWPSVSINREVERLGHCLKWFPFKTAIQLKAEVNGRSNISMPEGVTEEAENAIQLGRQIAAVNSKDGEEEAAILQKVQVVDEKRLGKSHVFGRINFQAGKPKGPEGGRRPTQTNRYKQNYVVVNVKHSASVMVWGCFSGICGQSFLYFLPPKTTMNGDRYEYMELLKENHHKASHFLQDGALCHKSKKVMAFLHQQNFSVIDWPGN